MLKISRTNTSMLTAIRVEKQFFDYMKIENMFTTINYDVMILGSGNLNEEAKKIIIMTHLLRIKMAIKFIRKCIKEKKDLLRKRTTNKNIKMECNYHLCYLNFKLGVLKRMNSEYKTQKEST